jgi:ribonuclease HI
MSPPSDPALVVVYTDGACDPNPGPGGWAALLLAGGRRKTLTGSDPHTTNNRMELQAVISALQALKRPCRVQLHTDSEYVHKGITEHLERWMARGWTTSGKRPVANRDLWEALEAETRRHAIEWVWVKGHAGDPLNEEVDRLAVGLIPRAELPSADDGAVHVFTGVSCLGPTGPGAWAVVVRAGGDARERAGYEAATSANRLQVMALVRGLEAASEFGEASARPLAHVYTASDYAAQGAERWARAWAASGWRTKDGAPVKHKELWQALLDQAREWSVRWHRLKDGARPTEAQQAEDLARKTVRAGGAAP